MAQFTFYGFTKFISHISFTIIRVNCAFGFVSDYVIVTDIMLFVYGVSLSAESDEGRCPLNPHHL